MFHYVAKMLFTSRPTFTLHHPPACPRILKSVLDFLFFTVVHFLNYFLAE